MRDCPSTRGTVRGEATAARPPEPAFSPLRRAVELTVFLGTGVVMLVILAVLLFAA